MISQENRYKLALCHGWITLLILKLINCTLLLLVHVTKMMLLHHGLMLLVANMALARRGVSTSKSCLSIRTNEQHSPLKTLHMNVV